MNRRLFTALAVTLAAGALAPLAATGCANDTGGQRFDFDAKIGGATTVAAGAPFTFTNEVGWTITLTKAKITLGPVYLNVVAPLGEGSSSRLAAPPRRRGLLDLLERSAFAAGESHLEGGRVVGQVLGQVTFDALSGELVPFPVRGSLTQDQVRTAEVWFYPEPGVAPDSTKAGSFDTFAVDVAGAATKGGATVRFRGALKLDETWQPDAAVGSRGYVPITTIRQLRGIPASFTPSEGGHLELRFDVTRLFRGADFGNLAANPSDPDGTKRLVQSKTGAVTTDQVMTNLYQGLRATGTYAVRWIAP